MREEKGKSLVALPVDYVVVDTETTGLSSGRSHIIFHASTLSRFISGSSGPVMLHPFSFAY